MDCALTVITPPTAEPVTLAQIKQQLRIDLSDTSDDALLTAMGVAARGWAETFLNRALITQQLRWVVRQVIPPGQAAGWSSTFSPFGGFPGAYYGWGGAGLGYLAQRPLELPRSPVQSVDAVAIGDPCGGPDTVLTPDQYWTDLALQPALVQIQSWALADGGFDPTAHVSVDFTVGYGPDAGEIPAGIIQAILLLTTFLYENRGDAGGEMPMACEMLLWPYRLVSFG